MAGATFPIITKRLGEGGVKQGVEVKRIQQLLARTGHNPKSNLDGGWGGATSTTAKAWIKYQESKGWIAKPYLDPIDAEDRLLCLAADAKVVMFICSWLRSNSATAFLTEMCRSSGIPYGWVKDGQTYGGGTKMAWGFDQRPNFLVFTLPGGVGSAGFDVNSPEPRALNCTSYSNLMLSVWRQGNAHTSPYDASQAVGGLGAQLGQRYGMAEIRTSANKMVFTDLAELKGKLQNDVMYHLAWARASDGFSTHDTVVINGVVYEANVGERPTGAVYSTPLDERWTKRGSGKGARLYGPGPY
jgi:hypothetical protein